MQITSLTKRFSSICVLYSLYANATRQEPDTYSIHMLATRIHHTEIILKMSN